MGEEDGDGEARKRSQEAGTGRRAMALKSNLDAVPFIIYQLVGSSMQVSTFISPRDLKEMEIH